MDGELDEWKDGWMETAGNVLGGQLWMDGSVNTGQQKKQRIEIYLRKHDKYQRLMFEWILEHLTKQKLYFTVVLGKKKEKKCWNK